MKFAKQKAIQELNVSRGIIGTIGYCIFALIFSGTLIVPGIIAIPFLPVAWLLSLVTDHYGAISDAILIWYAVFTYFWASYYPFWTTKIVQFFGIFNAIIAVGYGGIGEKNGISPSISLLPFSFVDTYSMTAPLFFSLTALVSVVYLVILYFVAKKGHQKYLAKIATIEAQEVEEAAQFTTCPHCAETILTAAKVCKHCGRDI